MINKLRDWGCDVEEALERFVNDQELYCTCFRSEERRVGKECGS